MKQDQQATLARYMIQVIRENADNSDIPECLNSFAFSLAHGLEVFFCTLLGRYEREFVLFFFDKTAQTIR